MSYGFSGNWEAELDRYLTTDPRDDAEPVCTCEFCGADIYEGETAYNINDTIICEKCVEDSRFTAEVE